MTVSAVSDNSMAASGKNNGQRLWNGWAGKLSRNPIPYRAAEYAQYRSDEERSDRCQQQNEAAPLAM